jgi:hypothetical protein
MILHDTLPVLIAIAGLFAGGFVLSRIKRLPKDRVLIFDFLCLGLVNFYVGGVYLLFAMGVIGSVSDLSVFVRPVNLLQIILPALITWRMGVI